MEIENPSIHARNGAHDKYTKTFHPRESEVDLEYQKSQVDFLVVDACAFKVCSHQELCVYFAIMVNTGRSSNGCLTCRLRRIQCDATYPACSKCTKSKRICLGYSTTGKQKILSNTQSRSAIERVSTPGSLRELFNNQNNGVLAHIRHLARYTREPNPSHSVSIEHFYNSDSRTIHITKLCFQSLREPSETREDRIFRHEHYRSVLQEVRTRLVAGRKMYQAILPIFCLATYEVQPYCSRARDLLANRVIWIDDCQHSTN